MANPKLPQVTTVKGGQAIYLRGANSNAKGELIGDGGYGPASTIQVPTAFTYPAFQIESPKGTIVYSQAINGAEQISLTPITGSGAIAVGPGNYVITDAAAAALTLAAPVAGAQSAGGQDGVTIWVVSATAYAHTITSTGNMMTGAAGQNTATFAAHPGASIELIAYNGSWVVGAANAIAFS